MQQKINRLLENAVAKRVDSKVLVFQRALLPIGTHLKVQLRAGQVDWLKRLFDVAKQPLHKNLIYSIHNPLHKPNARWALKTRLPLGSVRAILKHTGHAQ